MSEQPEPRVVLGGWDKDGGNPLRKARPTGCPECSAGNDKLKPTFGGRYCSECGWIGER